MDELNSLSVSTSLEIIEHTISKYVSTNHPIQILAVSKNQSLERIDTIFNQGMRLFGENRVQETIQKYEHYHHRDRLALHCIGTLQKNKVKKALQIFDLIQSVDSLELMAVLIKEQKKVRDLHPSKEPFPIFLQVKCYEAEQKHGFQEYDILKQAVAHVLATDNLFSIQGIMTIGPLSQDEYTIRKAFSTTRIWKEALEQEYGFSSLSLSMGMSEDYQWAIQEGATMIRIGNKLFGARD